MSKARPSERKCKIAQTEEDPSKRQKTAQKHPLFAPGVLQTIFSFFDTFDAKDWIDVSRTCFAFRCAWNQIRAASLRVGSFGARSALPPTSFLENARFVQITWRSRVWLDWLGWADRMPAARTLHIEVPKWAIDRICMDPLNTDQLSSIWTGITSLVLRFHGNVLVDLGCFGRHLPNLLSLDARGDVQFEHPLVVGKESFPVLERLALRSCPKGFVSGYEVPVISVHRRLKLLDIDATKAQGVWINHGGSVEVLTNCACPYQDWWIGPFAERVVTPATTTTAELSRSLDYGVFGLQYAGKRARWCSEVPVRLARPLEVLAKLGNLFTWDDMMPCDVFLEIEVRLLGEDVLALLGRTERVIVAAYQDVAARQLPPVFVGCLRTGRRWPVRCSFEERGHRVVFCTDIPKEPEMP
jgi:hypothetical protein